LRWSPEGRMDKAPLPQSRPGSPGTGPRSLWPSRHKGKDLGEPPLAALLLVGSATSESVVVAAASDGAAAAGRKRPELRKDQSCWTQHLAQAVAASRAAARGSRAEPRRVGCRPNV